MTLAAKMLTVLLLTLALSIPALAQEDSTATKTFELTLYGDVPEGETFIASYDIQDSEDPITELLLCGPEAARVCQGGDGTLYTASAELQTGFPSPYRIQFRRLRINRTFAELVESIEADTTNSAHYRFPSGDDMPDQLPDTGAGGLAGPGMPASSVAILAFIAVRAYRSRPR